jgi:hypothetical protein
VSSPELAFEYRRAGPLIRALTTGVRRVERALARVSLRRSRAISVVAVFSLAVSLGIALLMGVPKPHVHDEFSYLLAADTFVHGRSTNPPHPCAVHFETMHVLQRPTYASKYPPGQALFLSAGKVIGGHFIVGSWLAVALACAAVTWMLMAWIRPPWALYGGLLACLHPTVVLWGQCYHGGAPAMLGGSLLLGGMRRAVDFPSARAGLAMGLGIGILAITRPYEGFVLTLLSVASLVTWRWHRTGFAGFVRLAVFVPALIVPVAVVLMGLASYNTKVTGAPTRLPYTIYESQYSTTPLFLFQSSSRTALEFNNAEFARFNAENVREHDKQVSVGMPRMIVGSYLLAAKAFFPVLAAFLKEQSEGWWESARSLPLVVLQIPLFVWPCVVFSRAARVPSLMLGAFTCALALATWKNNQYAAPAFGLMFLLTVESSRLWRCWKWRGWPIGRFGQRIAMVCYILWPVLLFVLWPALKARPHMGHDRSALVSRLESERGRHLIIVRYRPRHNVHEEWVYNGADVDQAPVVWARDLGPERNRQLLDYFKDRHIWLLEPDESPERLVPYADPRAEEEPAQTVSPGRAVSAGHKLAPSLMSACHA